MGAGSNSLCNMADGMNGLLIVSRLERQEMDLKRTVATIS